MYYWRSAHQWIRLRVPSMMLKMKCNFWKWSLFKMCLRRREMMSSRWCFMKLKKVFKTLATGWENQATETACKYLCVDHHTLRGFDAGLQFLFCLGGKLFTWAFREWNISGSKKLRLYPVRLKDSCPDLMKIWDLIQQDNPEDFKTAKRLKVYFLNHTRFLWITHTGVS